MFLVVLGFHSAYLNFQFFIHPKSASENIISFYGLSIKNIDNLISFIEHHNTLLLIIGFSAFLASSLVLFYTVFKWKLLYVKTQIWLDKRRINLQRTISEIKQYDKSIKIALTISFLAILIIRTIELFQSVVIYDEAMSYTWFTGKGIMHTLADYQSPNNHVFYNLFCSLFKPFFNEPFYTIKLPVFLVSIISFPLFLRIFHEYLKPLQSLLLLITIQFSYFFSYYSIHGRGYVFIIIFTVLLIHYAYKWLNSPKPKTTNYIIIAALGMWTVPTFLYPLLSISLVVLFRSIKSKIELKKYVLTHIKLVLACLILYGPVLITSGHEAITNNQFVNSVSIQQLLHDFPNKFLLVQESITGWQHMWLIELLIITFLLFQLKNQSFSKIEKFLFFIFLSLEVVPIIIMSVQMVVPYSRIWSFQLISKMGLLVLFIDQIQKYFKYTKYLLIPMILSFITIHSYKVFQKLSQTKERFSDHIQLIDFIKRNKIKSVYARNYNMLMMLELEQMTSGLPKHITHNPVDGLELLIIDKNHTIDKELFNGYKQLDYKTEVYYKPRD